MDDATSQAAQTRIKANAASLLEVLDAMSQHIVALAQLAAESREAMQRHDPAALRENLLAQQGKFHALGELEKRRLGLAAHLSRAMAPQAAQPLTMQQLQARLPDASAQRFAHIRTQLREQLGRLHEQQRVNHTASARMHSHICGLLQRFASLLDGDVYGPRGCNDQPAHGMTAVNIEA